MKKLKKSSVENAVVLKIYWPEFWSILLVTIKLARVPMLTKEYSCKIIIPVGPHCFIGGT